MDMSAMLERLETADLASLAPVFGLLARRVRDHRLANNGYVPKEVFIHCLAIGGIYPCVELVIESRFSGRIALKKRAPNEDFAGQFHIVGVAGRITDGPDEIFDRLSQEVWGKGNHLLSQDNAILTGVEIHDEPERGGVVCWTLVYSITVDDEDMSSFVGEWKWFDDPRDPSIVAHQRETLSWHLGGDQGDLVFVRLG